jgi:hypothetical protein
MRWMIVLAGVMLAGGCGQAKALVPDPTNPAHCVAAFHWGAYWFNLSSSKHAPQPQKVAEMLAHARYEVAKIEASGGSEMAARKEGEELTRQYANEGDKLSLLMRDCGFAHASDPEFRRQWPALMAWANSNANRYPVHHGVAGSRPSGIVTFKADKLGSVWKVDADSVRGPRKTRQGWVVIDTSKDKTVAYQEERHLYQIDCDTTAARELSKITYDASRQPLSKETSTVEDAKVHYWPPNTFGAKIVSFMCDPKFDAPQP